MIGLHGQDQAFLRHREELFFKAADQHLGALDQRGYFIQQRIVFNRLHTAAHAGGCSSQLASDLGFALCKAGDHSADFSQRLCVLVGMLDDHGRNRGFKTVTLCGVAGSQTQRMHWNDIRAMQGQQAVGRPHKAHAAPAGQFAVALELIAHDFGDGQFGNGFEQGFLQALGQRCALDHAVVKQGLGLAVHGALELWHGRSISTECAQPFEQGGRCVTAGVQPHVHGHEFLRDGFVCGLCGHLGDVCSQPTR